MTRGTYNVKFTVNTFRLLFKDQPFNVISSVIAVSFENQMGHINTVCGKNVDFPLSKLVVALRSKALVYTNKYTYVRHVIRISMYFQTQQFCYQRN